jgi:hypothetical protein
MLKDLVEEGEFIEICYKNFKLFKFYYLFMYLGLKK